MADETLLTSDVPQGEADFVRPDDRIDDERHDEDNILKPAFVRRVKDALAAGHGEAAYDLVEPLHAADVADLLELLTPDERRALAAAITDLMSSSVIAELNDHVRDDMIDALPNAAVAEIAGELDNDDAVQLLEEMDEEDRAAVLAALDPEDRAAIESALSYPEETAGRLMSREFVAVPEHLSVGDLIDYLRDSPDLPPEFYEVFIVDERHHPVGTCDLSWILTTPRAVGLTDVMKRDQTLIPATLDQEEVGNMFQKYALISAAVVDQSGRLVGQLTVDDVVHIIAEEAGEDALLLSGAGDGDINEPIRDAYSARVRWLLANMLTASLASFVISRFEDVIAQMVVLAVLMPIVAGIGGNAGTQTLAVTVRALATNQLSSANTLRAVRREMLIALLNGASVAVIIGGVVALLFANPLLGAVIGAAMMTNILVAGIAGVLVPLTLDRLRVDPAISSSIFVTMTTDSIGFLAFLGFAVLSGLVG